MLPADWLDILKRDYPARRGGQGWAYVARRIPHLIDDGYQWADIHQGTLNYRVLCGRENKIGTEYVRMARTHFGPDLWFVEFSTMDLRTPDQKREEAFWQDLEQRAAKLGYSVVDRTVGHYRAAQAVEQAEREARDRVLVVPDKRLRVVR